MSAVSRVTGLTRAETYARIRALQKRGGLTHAQIGERLGLSVGGVRNLLNDPDGSKQRARRDRYRGTCRVCGVQTDGSNGRAAPDLCSTHLHELQHAERRWTQATVIRSFRRFHAETGRIPRATDAGLGLCESRVSSFSGARIREMEEVVVLGLVLPRPGTVQREFGTWAAALEAAGMEPSGGGGGTHRRSSYRKTNAEVRS
jgi:transcriptional regulator with XRE-family HTH domain